MQPCQLVLVQRHLGAIGGSSTSTTRTRTTLWDIQGAC
jgi:hypothetical protein